MPAKPNKRREAVPQAPQVHPDVVSAKPVQCVGGPADGQMMQCPVGRRLYVINAIDGMRAVSLPPDHLDMVKRLGGYGGHYDPADGVLRWSAP